MSMEVSRVSSLAIHCIKRLFLNDELVYDSLNRAFGENYLEMKRKNYIVLFTKYFIFQRFLFYIQ